MAERRIKGTLTCNSWDFYEAASAIGVVQGTVPAGPRDLAFYNNATAPGNLDLYRAELSLNTATTVQWFLAGPGTMNNAVFPIEGDVYCIDRLQAAPPGYIGVFTSSSLVQLDYVRVRQDPVTFDVLELANGGPFLTLAPTYSLVALINASAAVNFSLTVWFQWLLDMHPPA